MTYEEMTDKLNRRYYVNTNGLDFFTDLVEMNGLDSSDFTVSRTYSLAWDRGHTSGYYDVFLHFNDFVKVFKG